MKSSLIMLVVILLALITIAASSTESPKKAAEDPAASCGVGICASCGAAVGTVLTFPFYYGGMVSYYLSYPLIWLCVLFKPVMVFLLYLGVGLLLLFCLSRRHVFSCLVVLLVGVPVCAGLTNVLWLLRAVRGFFWETVLAVLNMFWGLFPSISSTAGIALSVLLLALVLGLALESMGLKRTAALAALTALFYAIGPYVLGALFCYSTSVCAFSAAAVDGMVYWQALVTMSFVEL